MSRSNVLITAVLAVGITALAVIATVLVLLALSKPVPVRILHPLPSAQPTSAPDPYTWYRHQITPHLSREQIRAFLGCGQNICK